MCKLIILFPYVGNFSFCFVLRYVLFLDGFWSYLLFFCGSDMFRMVVYVYYNPKITRQNIFKCINKKGIESDKQQDTSVYRPPAPRSMHIHP